MRLLLPLALLAGCGDVSNAWILEDVEFLDALPSEDRQNVALTDDAAKDTADAPSLLTVSRQIAENVNGTLFQVLWAVDEVRQLRPTARTEEGRIWGPFPFWEDVDLELTIERTSLGRFDWNIDAIGDTRVTYVQGVHYAGDTVAAGDGQFAWSYDEVGPMVGSAAAGSVAVDYDNRDGIDFLVTMDGVTDGTTDAVTANYAYRLGDTGDFQYATAYDLDGDGVTEDASIRTRWVPGGGGRADFVATGGSLGELVEQWSQCWDASLGLTYESDTYGWVEATGDETECAFTTFAAVDRI